MNTGPEDNEHPKEIGLMIDAEEEGDKELQKFANEQNVVLLAFIGSYVARRYNPGMWSRPLASWARRSQSFVLIRA